MNLSEGRIGRQEAACLTAMGIVVNGLFFPNADFLYEHGNSNYLVALISLVLLLLLFFVITRAMKRRRVEDLGMFFRDALGRVPGGIASLVVIAYLVIEAAIPLVQFLLILKQYIFPRAALNNICLYFIPALLLLACSGLETLGRTARVFIWPAAITFLLPLVLPIGTYETHYLYPLPFEAPLEIVRSGVSALTRGLAALLSLLICARGVHGVNNATKYGFIAILCGGFLVFLCQMCIGMAYSYLELRETLSPMYRMMMTSESGVYLRLDKLLLFFWVLTGLISSAFYLYAAALLFCRMSGMRDVRPPALSFAGGAITLTLLAGQADIWTHAAASMLRQFLFLLALVPPMIAALVSFFKKERTV